MLILLDATSGQSSALVHLIGGTRLPFVEICSAGGIRAGFGISRLVGEAD